MFPTLDKHKVLKTFPRLSFRAIPLISTTLLLPILLTQSLPSSQQSAKPSVTKQNSSIENPITALPKEAITNNSPVSGQGQHKRLAHQDSPSKKADISQSHHNKTQASQSQNHPSPAKAATLEMKVAVANQETILPIATSTQGAILNDAGQPLRKIAAGQAVYAQPASFGISLNTWQAPEGVWIVPTSGGYVYVAKHWYRGRVRLILQGSSLLAVNYVNLEDYLYSVVGSEMPSHWSLEALKAQAVAARSYALVQYIRRANEFYHLGATEAWQVYKGLDGESSSTHKAVDDTTGLFLSYKGGVVESLYAATDEIVIKAHGGLGMSQTGAQNLATQGYDYSHILGTYYPGANLAQLKS